MGSAGADGPAWRQLVSRRMALLVWLPIAVISILHYATPAHTRWIHDVLRRLYYVPILFAAFQAGLLGGLVAALVAAIGYLPHAFLHPVHFDPAGNTEKALEVVLYHVVGGVAGYLADRERKHGRELEQSLQEQQRLQRQLVRAGRLSALGEVMAGMAHEIKNPLHSLAGTAEVIDPVIPKEAEERRLWEIHTSELDRLGRVAEQFLSFARPTPPLNEPQDLRAVAERLRELVAAEAKQKHVDLSVDLPGDPIMVQGDRDQLAQVAMNIALNGFRAIGAAGNDRTGKMQVTVGRADHQGRPMHFLRIENDGPPLPEAELEQIFDPFHSDAEGGTGLGLAISARIAEQHHGFIEAENAGLGVTFTLHLPPLT